MLRLIFGAGVATAIVVGFASFGGTAWFGAHIFWDVKVAYIGAPIGALLAIALVLTPIAKFKRVGFWGVLTVLAFIGARYGQAQFAASFGDDQLAGVFWYFGWISTSAGMTALLISLFSKA